MTLDVYGHLFPSDEAACAVALDKVTITSSASAQPRKLAG
jgi:hypothetical protein